MKPCQTVWSRWLALVLLFVASTAANAQPRDDGQYRILQARYGTAERNVDVTRRLQELARADQPFRMGNDTFGVDPDEGRVKTLRIYARGPNGDERLFEYREGSVVDGAQFSGWRGGDWGQGGSNGGWNGSGGGGASAQEGQFRIQQALYGTSRRNVDVTRRLQELARADATFRMGNDTFGVDPDEGRVKTLRIYARGPRGENRMFEYREGSVIDGAQFSGWRRGDWGGGKGPGWGGGGAPAARVQIVRAVYGAGNRVYDVTDRLGQILARDGRIDLVVNYESMGGDPAEHVPKTLSVTWSDGRSERQVRVREEERLRLP
ncbi:MAG: hypothetical protein ABI781_13430 [Burkholderiales bacterium]